MSVNQAVIFTKPVHHLRTDLSPEELNQRLRCFFEQKGFQFVVSKKVSGADLKAREVIKEHYLMYSAAACAETVRVDAAAKERFEAFFGRTWQSEMDAGRIVPMPRLLSRPGMDAHQLFTIWRNLCAGKQAVKLQAGLIMGFIEELNVYAINAFYPSLEEIFYDLEARLDYHVVEFDSSQTSWKEFRRNLLGTTNVSTANPESFRGKLYGDYPVEFPDRDNYVHGSAGPVEGVVERTIHEADFDITTNPVGAYLAERGVTLQSFSRWRKSQPLAALGNLFDETEEKNTDEIFQALEKEKALLG
ncbi:MAG: hypothetical protein ISR85_00135 [Kiritimatiellales bacterium]|nr:hypothetical protein [Kiritimatiellota bacterium]MBL7011320.1 hypothetical protein [Kiritimatiellales bacterium]